MTLVCADPIKQGPNKGLPATGTNAGYARHRRAGESGCEACLTSAARRVRQWNAANPEKVLAQNRKWRAANPERKREWDRRWRAANPDKVSEYSRRYRETHPETFRASLQRYAEANPDRIRASKRRWQAANPDSHRARQARRRARKAEALTIPFTVDQLAQRMAYWGNACWMCRGPYEEVDHVIALAAGGPHCLSNLRPACKSCNASKGARRAA
jgi:5-methylcytosine-specific restriction endonuclease McrA